MVAWLPSYDRRYLRGDLAAGIAVTALVVPKNLGYADIAGVPLQNGLYAAAVGGIVYALFATSRHISTGPSSSLAAVAGGAVVVTGLGGEQAAQLVAAIALATGLLFLLFALLRLGWIASFLSKAVVTGFLAGAAIDVVIGELPKLTGTSAEGKNAWRELGSWLGSLGDMHWTTLLVGVTALGVILGLRRLAPAVPGALVLVAGGLVASSLFDLGAHGVALVGDVPSGLPVPELPDLGSGPGPLRDSRHRGGRVAADRVLPDRRRCSGVRCAAPLPDRRGSGVGRSGNGERRRGRVSGDAGVDQPLGQLAERVRGRANAGRVARDRRPGTRDPAVPRPAVLGPPEGRPRSGDHRRGRVRHDRRSELRRLYRVTRFDFWVAVAAIVAVLSVGVLAGVVVGVVLSLGWLVYVATRPPMPLLGRQPGTQVFRELDENPADETFPGIAVLRIDGGLFFATAEGLEERVRELAKDGHQRALVLDLEGVNFIDSQGAAKLTEIHELTEADGVTLRLARVKPQVRAVLEADGIVDRIGADHIHGNVHLAVEAQLAESADGS